MMSLPMTPDCCFPFEQMESSQGNYRGQAVLKDTEGRFFIYCNICLDQQYTFSLLLLLFKLNLILWLSDMGVLDNQGLQQGNSL